MSIKMALFLSVSEVKFLFLLVRLTLHDDEDDVLAAVGSTPRTVDEELSPRNSLEEEEDDTTLHPSSRDSVSRESQCHDS